MKWIGRGLYLFVVLIVSFFVYMFSVAQKYYKFFESNMTELTENYDRERYIQTVMTDEILLTSYLKDPIYFAKSEEEGRKFEFGIYQFKYENPEATNYVSTIFFRDLGIKEIDELIEEEPAYVNNPNLVKFRVSIFYNDEEEAAVGYIDSYRLNQKMFYFATIDKFEGNLNYLYNQSVDGKQTMFDKDLVTKIQIDLVNGLKEEAVETPILEVKHDNASDNTGENQVVDGKAGNFNGKVSYHDLKENYENKELLGKVLYEELSSFRGVTIKTNVIYYSILVVITYLIYFLRPTINYFNNRQYRKKQKEKLIDSE